MERVVYLRKVILFANEKKVYIKGSLLSESISRIRENYDHPRTKHLILIANNKEFDEEKMLKIKLAKIRA